MVDAVEGRLLGELAIVVIRAQHLSDRSKIGKHHPYVALKYGNTKVKTPVVKKGGQHPTFDAEVRFKITEDAEDIMTRQSDAGDRDSSGSKRSRRIPKNKSMVVSVFADDPKEPKLVGETVVDLTTVFEKCEHDDMFQLKYKDMFAGEIYLEMTYFINDAPPIPKKIPKPVSWMDYGATGPLPTGPTRHSSLETRLPHVPGQPTAFAPQGGHDPHRRGSFSAATAVAYIPPPTFPGRNARVNHSALPQGLIGPASAGPSSQNPPYAGMPSSSEVHPEYQGHGHRHSLNGAIPQHGSWQNDQSYPRPPTSSYETQPIPPYPSQPYHSLPNAAARNPNAASSYAHAPPPVTSFPNLSDMTMALPPVAPPPTLEFPGSTTSAPPTLGILPPGMRPATTPIPDSYPYPPSRAPMNAYPPPVNAHPPLPVLAAVNPPSDYAHTAPRASQHGTYPLYENRPASSVSAIPPPDRPYSSASTHYPSTVTSSFHVSSANTAPAAHVMTSSGWMPPPPAHYTPSGYSADNTASRPQYSLPPGENTSAPRYDPPRDPSYTDTTAYGHSAGYAPPPRPLSAAPPVWAPQEPETKPGRSYLRSLGVGSPSSNSQDPAYSYQPPNPQPQLPESAPPWQSAPTGNDALYGYQTYDPSGPPPPVADPAQMYQTGPSRPYDQSQHPSYSGF
ncbi:hypothetical protein NCC49_002734 [Naganishia albida]|nr:hypothetical protein NCC49_002734 [Naganishia albida]